MKGGSAVVAGPHRRRTITLDILQREQRGVDGAMTESSPPRGVSARSAPIHLFPRHSPALDQGVYEVGRARHDGPDVPGTCRAATK